MASPKPIVYVDQVDVSRSHQLAVRCEVLGPGGPLTELPIIGGEVTMDSGSEARGRCEVQVPGEPEWLPTRHNDLLAPYGNELRISRGIEYADRIELCQLGIFRIDRASIDSGPERTISISGVDRTILFIDAPFEAAGQVNAGTNYGTAIIQVLAPVATGLHLPGWRFTQTVRTLPFNIHYAEGEDRWTFARDLALVLGGELFFDRQGVLIMQPVPPVTAGAVARFTEGEGGILLGAGRDMDRERVSNRWIVTGKELNDTGATARGIATDDNPYSPTYYYGKFGRKPFFYSNAKLQDNQMCEDAAAGGLARTIGQPDSIVFSAIVDPARAPSDVIYVERTALGIAEYHILDSVSIPLTTDGEMSCTTRIATALIE